MPRAKKSGTLPPGTEFKGFVTVNLTKADEDHLANQELDVSRLFDNLAAQLDRGYKFTAKVDANSGSVCCTLMDVDPKRVSFGFAMSGWGQDMADALAALLYKHLILCVGEWPTELAGRPVSRFR